MKIIKQNNNYILPFTVSNLTQIPALDVKVLFSLNTSKLQIINITGASGIVNPLNASEYILPTLNGGLTITVYIEVKVLIEAQDLNITAVTSTSTPEINLSNNTITKNLLLELDGILCSDINACYVENITSNNNVTFDTINSNEIILYPLNAQEGDVYVVNTLDVEENLSIGLTAYKFNGTIWENTLDIPSISIRRIQIPSTEFANVNTPTIQEVETFVATLPEKDKKHCFITYDYVTNLNQSIFGQIYSVVDNNVILILDNKNNRSLTLTVDLINGTDDDDISDYIWRGSKFFTLNKLFSYIQYLDYSTIRIVIENSTELNKAVLGSTTYILENKRIIFQSNLNTYISLTGTLWLTNIWLIFGDCNIYFDGNSKINAEKGSLIYLTTVGSKIHLHNTINQTAVMLNNSDLVVMDGWNNPSTLVSEIIYRANGTALCGSRRINGNLNLHNTIISNPNNFTECRIVASSNPNTSLIGLMTVHAIMNASYTISNVYWGGAANINISTSVGEGLNDTSCSFNTGLHNLLPLADWVLKCNRYIPKPYKSYVVQLRQSGTNAPVATILENDFPYTPVWTRSSTGFYGVYANYSPTDNFEDIQLYSKVVVTGSTKGLSSTSKIDIYYNSEQGGAVYIKTYLNEILTDGVLSDNNNDFFATVVDIKVYP